jgi:peptidoglycan/xylan/chitin deacetylase (PgdA/CDA1 family)
VRDDRHLLERTRVLSGRHSVSAFAGAALAAACLGAIASGCGSSTSAAGTSPPPMNWTRGQTVVSIEFDDGSADQFGVRSILASHHIKGTFFINSGHLINSYHMTWQQVHRLYAEGNEIAGHTVLHQHLTALSSAEARREVCNDRSTLLRQGFAVADFAFPYGDYNAATQAIPQECGYNSARWILGVYSPSCQRASCPFAESIPPVDPYLTRTPQNILETDSLANIEGYVTQAQQHGGGWVQIVFHHICDQCDTYAVTEPVFREFIDWLAGQKNTTTATIRQVIGGPLQPAVAGPESVNLPGPNLLRNPSLEQASPQETPTGQRVLAPTGWETDSYGTNSAQWTRTTDAHSGRYAESVDVTSLTSGAAQLLSKMDLGEYAPVPTVGHTYDVSAYYKSTVPAMFYIYTRDQLGEWNWWKNSSVLPASSKWTKGAFTTPPIPAGMTGISVGLGIAQKGTLTMDDFSLSPGE